MTRFFRALFRRSREEKADFFHYFVAESPAREKKKVIKQVVMKVNEDQRAVIEKAKQYSGHPIRNTL